MYIHESGDYSVEAEPEGRFHHAGDSSMETAGWVVSFCNIGDAAIRGLSGPILEALLEKAPEPEVPLAALSEVDIDSAADQLPHAA